MAINRAAIVIAFVLIVSGAARAQTVINCANGFASSGSCGVSLTGSSGQPFQLVTAPGASLSGSKVIMLATGTTHEATGLIYQTKVNDQAFSTTFTFIPNGMNVAFVLQNNTNTDAAGTGGAFAAGAGCEAGFYQAFTGNHLGVNNIFALELDSYSPLTSSGSFTYSSAQIYQANQSPCIPLTGGIPSYYTSKVSTYPVPLNSPASAQNTSTGDTYSVTLTYTGTTLVMNMYDVTAAGSCPGASCFTHTWDGVYIPSLVGSTRAYTGFTGATGITSSYPLYLNSFAYTVLSPEATRTQPQLPR